MVQQVTNGLPELLLGTEGGGNYQEQAQAYSAAPIIELSRGKHAIMTITDAVAFVLGAPVLNGAAVPAELAGLTLMITLRNTSGGAHGAGTFNAVFKTAGAVPAIATGNSRAFFFVWNGTNWVEKYRTAADVAN